MTLDQLKERLGFVPDGEDAEPAGLDQIKKSLGFIPDDADQEPAVPGAAGRLPLDERQRQREQIESQADALHGQERDAIEQLWRRWMSATGGRITHGDQKKSVLAWAQSNAPDEAAAIENLRTQREQLLAQAERFGVGQRGRNVGATVVGILGADSAA